MSGNVTVKLSAPIKAHDEEISEITLRAPTPEDVMEVGIPQLVVPSADGVSFGVEVRPSVVGRYISRLGAIPMGSVKKLSIADFQRCTNAVMGFFNNGDSEI